MNFTELANLSTIIDQVKMVINASGHARFSKEIIRALQKRLLLLENLFVKGVVESTDEGFVEAVGEVKNNKQTEQRINQVTTAASTATVEKVVTVQPPVTVEVPETPLAPAKVESDGVTTVVSAPTDEELTNRLAEEKAKLNKKSKKSNKSVVSENS